MVDNESFKKMALSLMGTIEEPHFEKSAFKVKKKIFATLSEKENIAVLKLNEIDQSVFCSYDKTAIYPVKGAWGKKGWTMVDLIKVRKDMLEDALLTAYEGSIKANK